MDPHLLLSACKLTLATDLKVTSPRPGFLVVKNISARTYLNLDDAQWRLLQHFNDPQTVPQVLATAIETRTAPALHDFYELVLKAYNSGLLLFETPMDAADEATEWKFKLPPFFLSRWVVALLVVGLGLVFWERPEPSFHWFDLLLGLVVWCGLLSLSQFLVACELCGADMDVYAPRIRWWPVPHFTIDDSDRCMVEQRAQIAILLTPAALCMAGTAILLSLAPGACLIPLVGTMVLLHPLGGGAMDRLLAFLEKPPLRSIDSDPLFEPNRQIGRRWHHVKRSTFSRAAWIRLAYAVAWMAGALFLTHFFGGWDFREFARDYRNWVVVVAVLVAGPVSALAIFSLREGWRLAAERYTDVYREFLLKRSRRQKVPDFDLADEDRQQWLVHSPLFRGLNNAERAEVASLLTPHFIKDSTTVIRIGDRPESIALIVSGEAEIFRRHKNGRRQLMTRVIEGEIFGAHHLLDPEHPDVEVRASTHLHVMLLDIPSFQRFVINRIGPDLASSMALKLPALKRLSLCRQWHGQSVERFAQLSTVVDFATDATILRENDDCRYFFVIYEGTVRITRRNRTVATLAAGQYFGEISLLQNSQTTTAVLGGEETRCLYIPQRDFLRFVTHNYSAALELERVSSKRLGRPIFPLKR